MSLLWEGSIFMRMWGVDPAWMCQQHLLGEHVELHMLAGCIRRGKSIAGFLNVLVDPALLLERHSALVAEMQRRGMRHNSPIDDSIAYGSQAGRIDVVANQRELTRRCRDCRIRREELVNMRIVGIG